MIVFLQLGIKVSFRAACLAWPDLSGLAGQWVIVSATDRTKITFDNSNKGPTIKLLVTTNV